MTSTETLRARIERAVEHAETQKEALFRSDGSRFYSDEEHQRRLEAIVEEIGRVAGEVDEEAARLIEDREHQLDRYLHNDPTDALLSDQLASANLRRPFVKEDCEEMPLAELVNRCRGVLVDDTKEKVWLYARYARRRANQTLEKLNTGNASSETQRTTAASLRELEEVVVRLENKSKPTLNKREAEKTTQEIEAARGLRTYVRQRRSDADGTTERARRESAERMRAAF